jgi:hypothetical protein
MAELGRPIGKIAPTFVILLIIGIVIGMGLGFALWGP